jgi:hypothetical protein
VKFSVPNLERQAFGHEKADAAANLNSHARKHAGDMRVPFVLSEITAKQENLMKTIYKSAISVVKVLVLLPLWLLLLPLRRDRIFRHYSWTLDGFRRGSFTKQAYFWCSVFWLLLGCLIFYISMHS